MTASVVSVLATESSAPNAGPPPVARNVTERKLAVHLAWQMSPLGREHQKRVTDASKVLVDAVGGHTSVGDLESCTGQLVSTVFHRLGRRVSRMPGNWLLRIPLSDERLEQVPGAFYIFLLLRIRTHLTAKPPLPLVATQPWCPHLQPRPQQNQPRLQQNGNAIIHTILYIHTPLQVDHNSAM